MATEMAGASSQSVLEGDDEHVDEDENKPPEADPDEDLDD